VVDDKKKKTPEELGEAVGEKIEALFGDTSGPVTDTDTAAMPQVPGSPAAPVRARERAGIQSLEDLLDRIEAVILNLEWEAKLETIRELATRFKELEPHFPGDSPARNVINMSNRVLQRYSSPGIPPHPMLVKLLQDSVGAVKQVHSSHGSRPPEKELMNGIAATYKQIAASAEAARVAQRAEDGKEALAYGSLVGHVGSAVSSLDEVGQRLGRILGVLRQGGEMSEEEITRRLGTLGRLLSERVQRLSSLHKQMSRLTPPREAEQLPAQGVLEDAKSGPDGLLLVEWSRVPLAIPSSMISALYPLTKPQAEQFMGKASIVLANRSVPRLPLKRPRNSTQAATPIPSWLIHLSSAGKDFFLLADRALGYRRAPKGVDLSRENRIKIGNTAYSVLSQAPFSQRRVS